MSVIVVVILYIVFCFDCINFWMISVINYFVIFENDVLFEWIFEYVMFIYVGVILCKCVVFEMVIVIKLVGVRFYFVGFFEDIVFEVEMCKLLEWDCVIYLGYVD